MELTSNLLQFLVTLLGFCLGAILYRQNRRQAYFLLACFYGCFALGSLYWTLYLLLFSETPRVFYVSEFGWIASVIFLRILQYALSGEEERAFKCRAAWLSAIVGVPLMALYCAYGDILSNLIWCGLAPYWGLPTRRSRLDTPGICSIFTSGSCALPPRKMPFGLPAASGGATAFGAPPSGVIFC